jgi:pyrimidine deaminase RibD-like protein
MANKAQKRPTHTGKPKRKSTKKERVHTRNDRDYMQLAITQMLKSRSEHPDKIDPLVGSVLVDANGVEISHAHRGKIRPGEHGEFTLLKKSSGGTSSQGGTVFVTLEPCIGRDAPQKGCAQWIVEAKVKRVVIGMVDPSPKIKNNGISYLRRHGIQVDFFDTDLADIKTVVAGDDTQYADRPQPHPWAYHGNLHAGNEKLLSPADT